MTPQDFLSSCQANNVKIERITDSIITLVKYFPAGSKEGYTNAEMDVSILYDVPQLRSAGSTWGTDGASIGGMVGLNGGYMRLNRSGCKKSFLKDLQKLLNNA